MEVIPEVEINLVLSFGSCSNVPSWWYTFLMMGKLETLAVLEKSDKSFLFSSMIMSVMSKLLSGKSCWFTPFLLV